MKIKGRCYVAASVLSANFANIERDIRTAEDAGADWIHMDVMDGHFVPNLTFGPKMVKDVRAVTKLPLDVHLMVERPETLLDEYLAAGSDYLTFHVEAAVHTHRILSAIKAGGAKAGLSLVPSTPVSVLEESLDMVDTILIMSVNPGFGGQKLIYRCLKKVEQLTEARERLGLSFLVAVDGGINEATAADVRNAGTDVLISGSAFFSSDNPAEQVRLFKGIAVA